MRLAVEIWEDSLTPNRWTWMVFPQSPFMTPQEAKLNKIAFGKAWSFAEAYASALPYINAALDARKQGNIKLRTQQIARKKEVSRKA